MTELETLERSKMYMEKLANGIHPITGAVLPDEDVINDVRLSRCFFYIADILRQVIEHGGVVPQKKSTAKKLAFSLPVEARSAVDLSPSPIPASEIARRINELIDQETMSKLSYRAITDWLISIELLEETVSSSKKLTKRPTPQGESLGIFLETRTGHRGPYVVALYTPAAQQFVVDNLDAIIEFERSEKENHWQPWSREHDEALADLYGKGAPIKEIAMALKRSNTSIRARLKKLGLLS